MLKSGVSKVLQKPDVFFEGMALRVPMDARL